MASRQGLRTVPIRRRIQQSPSIPSRPIAPSLTRTDLAVGATVSTRLSSVDPNATGLQGQRQITGRIVDLDQRGRNRTAVVEWNSESPVRQSSQHVRSLVLATPAIESDTQTESESEDSGSDTEIEEQLYEEHDKIVSVHDVEWKVKRAIVLDSWTQRHPSQCTTSISINRDATELDFLKRMWPIRFFPEWITATNYQLQGRQRLAPNDKERRNYRPLNESELYRFIACLLFMTHYGLPRCEYWEKQRGMYPEMRLGKQTGISRNRFNAIVSCLSFALPPIGRMTEYHEIDTLLGHFHASRATVSMNLGDNLCIDELFSSWLGVNMPHVMKNKHKPKGIGQEMICLSDCASGIMVALELVKGKATNAELSNGLRYGPAVTLRLATLAKITGTCRRIVGDSRFASLETAKIARKNGFEFTGLVKSATRGFPKTFLHNSAIYSARGDTLPLKTQNGILAFGWFDCSTRHPDRKRIKTFVSTCGTTLPGAEHVKYRSKVVDGVTERYSFTVPRAKVVADYFDGCGSVDRHNHLRQGVLALETAWGTQKWSSRVISTLFGVFQTDSLLAYRFLTQSEISFRDFNRKVYEQILAAYPPKENDIEHATSADPCWLGSLSSVPGSPRQKRCRENQCGYKSGTFCVTCSPDTNKPVVLCDPKNGRNCFSLHVIKKQRVD